MKKNKNKKKKSPFILSDQNNHSKLFDDINLDDFKDRRKNLGELEKLYMNLESEYDDIDPDEEYRKISKANKKKHHKKRRKHVFDDIIELNDWDDIDEKTDDFDDEIPVVPNQSIRLDSASSDSLPAPVSSTMSDPDINANPIKDRALQIAEDFADRTNIILVDGVCTGTTVCSIPCFRTMISKKCSWKNTERKWGNPTPPPCCETQPTCSGSV